MSPFRTLKPMQNGRPSITPLRLYGNLQYVETYNYRHTSGATSLTPNKKWAGSPRGLLFFYRFRFIGHTDYRVLWRKVENRIRIQRAQARHRKPEKSVSKCASSDQPLELMYDGNTLTWIYADRLKTNPERRHKVKGRTSFAFSDIRRIIAEAALDPDFDRVCPKYSSSPVNSVVAVLLRMVA